MNVIFNFKQFNLKKSSIRLSFFNDDTDDRQFTFSLK